VAKSSIADPVLLVKIAAVAYRFDWNLAMVDWFWLYLEEIKAV